MVVQIINNHQSWPILQQTPLNKHHLATANHRPGKPDTLSQHASVKPDTLSQYASHPSMHSKSHCIEGAARAQNSGQTVGVRRTQYRGSAEPVLQHLGKLGKAQCMRHKTAAAS